MWLYWRLRLRGGLTADFAAVMAVPGQMRRSEVRCIYDLAANASRAGVIVEIGSFRGLSTAALARGSLRGVRVAVYAVDPHDYDDPGTYPGSSGTAYDVSDQRAFSENLFFAGVTDVVRPISMFSEEARQGWSKPISLLWIDGNHEFEAVLRDFDQWSPFVNKDGFVAFHDAAHPEAGPTRVVQGACATGKWKLMQQVEKVAVLERV